MVRPLSRISAPAGLFALVALLTAGVPSTAVSQDSDAEKAQKYYKKGMQAVYDEEYAIAITNFKRAHSLNPSGTLLYNISIAYSRMGKPEKALEHSLEAAERDDLPKDTAVKNRARIASYTVANTSRSITGETGAKASGPEASPEESTSESTEETAGTGGTEGTGSAPGRESGGSALTWLGAGVGLAGAGAVGWAVVLNFNVRDAIEAKRTAEEAGNYQEADRLYGQIQSRQQLGQILVYSGAGAMALGTTLLIVDAASSGASSRRAVRLTGGPTRGGWSLGLDLRF